MRPSRPWRSPGPRRPWSRPSGSLGGVEAGHAGEQQGDDDAGDDEQPRGDPALIARPPAARACASASTRRAPYTRSGRTAAMLPTARNVITASPIPIRVCTPSIAAVRLAERDVDRAADGVEADEDERGHRDRDQRTERRRPGPPIATRLGRTSWTPRNTTQPTSDGDDAHQEDVGAERGDAAVGEQQALDEEARRSCTAARSPGPTSTAASAPPSRWPLVPDPTGKLSIWVAKTNVATRPASGAVRSSSSRRAPRRASPIADRRDDAGRQRRRRVQEAVGHVHG